MPHSLAMWLEWHGDCSTLPALVARGEHRERPLGSEGSAQVPSEEQNRSAKWELPDDADQPPVLAAKRETPDE